MSLPADVLHVTILPKVYGSVSRYDLLVTGDVPAEGPDQRNEKLGELVGEALARLEHQGFDLKGDRPQLEIKFG